MTRFEALVSLNMVLDIGSIRLAKLLEAFGAPQDILKASRGQLMEVSGIGERIAAKICAIEEKDLDAEMALVKKLSLAIVTIDDAGYPENLKNIPGAPPVLYVKGKLLPEDKKAIAIVGSRRASLYGLTHAQKLAGDLARRRYAIISGMARGIDTYAHRGSLKAGGRSVAVIGSGFNHVYPAENRKLAEEISGQGAVVSEFPCDTMPFKQNFPRRNRIISGLSLGTVVVEAARNSGALITADFALEQGREVFALPGKIDSSTSYGTNGLIKQGAKLISSAEDIIEEYEGVSVEPVPRRYILEAPGLGVGSDELKLYHSISHEPIPIDEIAEKTHFEIPKITDILLRLRLKKLIKEVPGHQFVRNG